MTVFSGSSAGLVPAATPEDAKKVLLGNGTWKEMTVFSGSSAGLVPAATPEDAKKVLLGNGTWGSAEDDAAAMTISEDLILTVDSPRTLVLTASASGLSVRLPNHATLPEGTTFHIIVRPLEDIKLCDSTGQPIKAYPVLSASSAIRVQLVDASTGLWALSEYKSGSTSDAQGKPGLNIGELTIFSSANIFSISVASLSESKAIACYNDSGNSNYGTACVLSISGTTVSVGEPTVFNSAYTNSISVAHLSESKAIVCYYDNGNSSHGTASVLSVSGTTVSAESKNDITLAKTTKISVASLSESKAIVCYQDSGNSDYGTVRVLSISGTTVSAGNKTVFNSASTSYISVATLSESKAIVCYTRSNNKIARVLSISGTTVSVGGETVFNSVENSFVSVEAMSESKAVVCYNTKSKGTACVLSISGTTVSAGSETTFSLEFFSSFSVAAISEGKAIVCGTSNGKGTVYVLSISGTTVSVGGEMVFSFSFTNYISGAALPSSTGKIVTAFYDDTYDVGKTCVMLFA